MSAAKDRIIKQQQETIRKQLIAINELRDQLKKVSATCGNTGQHIAVG